jgi:lipopolysaccharide/colanic/teichoic acid biosynthesis glycosyltransferase
MYKFFKRLFDIIISFTALIVLIPLFIIIMVLIFINDRGNPFYLGERIGKDCKKIKIIKFRSMVINAPDYRNPDNSTYNSKNDSRVTKIGRFLRETSIDELPQLINILKGDMSLIGPRASTWDALPSYKANELDKMKVRPGLTGYCQAYYRNSLSASEKRLKDAWYANHVSFGLDMKIFFKTISTVLLRKNLYVDVKNDNK